MEQPEPTTFSFDGSTPYFAIILEFERQPMVVGTFDEESAFAVGRWLADKPKWHEIFQAAIAQYAEDREREVVDEE